MPAPVPNRWYKWALLLALGLLPAGPVLAQPKIPVPTLRGLLGESLVAKARVRWSKMIEGQKIEIIIGVGAAQRLSPQWSPSPARLSYDLNRNHALEKAIKQAHLGTPSRAVSTAPESRTLELLGQGPEGWVVVGMWSMPRRSWQKNHKVLFELLEPLFEAPADTFAPRSNAPMR